MIETSTKRGSCFSITENNFLTENNATLEAIMPLGLGWAVTAAGAAGQDLGRPVLRRPCTPTSVMNPKPAVHENNDRP